jgi:DNA repair exonuclease SbcCD ATPase subunit
MKIKKVEWRNFFSYGNKKQELVFKNEHSLVQSSGANGAGKSSISQIIIFLLYGKVEGKKLKDIPNRINGNAWARIEISTKHGEVAIERGLEPNIFRLFVNGIEYDQAGKKSIQEYITDDILGIPYYVFNNTILLSINDFKSFIKMGVADKRAIIDRIFGFEVLNTMREILREEIRRIKSSFDSLDGQLQSTMRSLESSMNEMESAAIAIDEESQNRIQGWESEMEKFESLKTLHTQKIEDFKTAETELMRSMSSANASFMELELNIKNQRSKLKLYENDQCPTCHSALSGDFHESAKSALIESISDLESDLESAGATVKKLEAKYDEMTNFKSDLVQKGERIKAKIQSISEAIRSEKRKSVKTELSSLQKLVESLETDKDRIEGEKIKAGERGMWLKTLDEILGEKGVKQLAIRSVLPTLNSQIQDLLIEMGVPYRVNFDEEFNAVLTHMGMEISVSTLSTGEMKKVDFSVLMAIVRLMKIKFSGLNLLFLDEIFSSVDAEGIGAILKILRKNSQDLGLNVFVINHAPMPLEIFDSHLEIRKSNNFSEIHFDS